MAEREVWRYCRQRECETIDCPVKRLQELLHASEEPLTLQQAALECAEEGMSNITEECVAEVIDSYQDRARENHLAVALEGCGSILYTPEVREYSEDTMLKTVLKDIIRKRDRP